jgi:catechol 2,3-dioxygenase-like lactoylglutathione lyase family enzyme
MGIEINGMAHVILTVSDFPAARAFYGKLLSLMGMTAVCDTDKFFYCVGGRTAIGIEPCALDHRHERFVQARVGLHHLCLRARSRDDVDACAATLKDMGATIVRGPLGAHGHPAITMFFSRIRTAYAWKSTTCLVPGFSLTTRLSIPTTAIGEHIPSGSDEVSTGHFGGCAANVLA